MSLARWLAASIAAAWLWSGAGLAQPLILVVEGVNPYRMLGPLLGGVGASGLESGYLERSPLVGAMATRFDAEVRRLDWSGIPTDAAGLGRAVAGLGDELSAARSARRDVYLVSHSLGSVIAVLALAGAPTPVTEPLSAPAAGRGPTLITLSSPLGRPQLLLGLVQFHPDLPLAALAASPPSAERLGLGRWINIHTSTDALGGPILAQGVEDWSLVLRPASSLPGLADLVWAHVLPFRDATVVERLIATLSGTASPRP